MVRSMGFKPCFGMISAPPHRAPAGSPRSADCTFAGRRLGRWRGSAGEDREGGDGRGGPRRRYCRAGRAPPARRQQRADGEPVEAGPRPRAVLGPRGRGTIGGHSAAVHPGTTPATTITTGTRMRNRDFQAERQLDAGASAICISRHGAVQPICKVGIRALADWRASSPRTELTAAAARSFVGGCRGMQSCTTAGKPIHGGRDVGHGGVFGGSRPMARGTAVRDCGR